MPYTIKHTRVACRTTTGTQDITITEMGPAKAALFFLNTCITNGAEAAHCVLMIGATDGTNHRSVLMSCEDNVATTNSWTKALNDMAVFTINANTGTLEGKATASWITDGVQLNWTGAPSAAFFLDVIFFCGDIDVSVDDVKTDVDTDYITGWKPEVIFCFGANNDWNGVTFTDSSTTSSTSDAAMGWGFRDKDNATSFGFTYADAVPMGSSIDSVFSIIMNNYCYNDYSAYANFIPKSNGFDIDSLSLGGVSVIGFLAISFRGEGNTKVGFYNTPTATGAQAISAGLKPIFVLELHTFLIAYNTGLEDNGGCFGVGIFSTSSPDDHTLSGRVWNDQSDPPLSNSICKSRQAQQNATLLRDPLNTVTITATLTSFDTGGYTKNWSVVDGTTKKFAFMAIGPPINVDAYTRQDDSLPHEEKLIIGY